MQPKFTQKRLVCFKLIALLFIAVIFSAGKTNAQCTWTASTAYPLAIFDGPAAVSVGSTLYAFGGSTSGGPVNNSYSFNGTTWTAIAPLPAVKQGASAVTDGTDIYILGGVTGGVPTNTLYRYNVATNTYTTLASFVTGTWNQACVFLNGKIYKIAGTGPATGSTNAVEIYDVASNTWSAGANYPQTASFVGATAIGNFVYTAGGVVVATVTALAKTYRYDPATNTWDDAAIADLPGDRWAAAYAGYNGEFVMAGGATNASTTISNTVVSWNPGLNAWSTLPTMTTAAYRIGGVSFSGSFHAIGGSAFAGGTANQKLTCIPPTPCTGTPAPGNTVVAGTLFSEGFNNIATLTPGGWFMQNNSQPTGATGWFQGNSGVFAAQSGPATSYIAANFNNTTGLNTISNWLLTPNIPMNNGDVFTFWTRSVGGTFPDRLQVRMSTNGNSTNVGSTNTSVGDFTTLLVDINPTYTSTGYPVVWTQYTITMSGLPGAGVSGRLAFRYFVENAGPAGGNSDYIGIDNVVYSTASNMVCPGELFTLSIQNVPAPSVSGYTYQWQSSPDNTTYTDIPGANSVSLTISQTSPTWYRVRMTCTNSGQSATSTPIQMVSGQGVFTAHPTNASTQCSQSASFSVAATGKALTWQWEYRTSSSSTTWLAVANGGTTPAISGATSNTLTLNSVPSSWNGYQFRAVMSGQCTAPDFSNIATLTVTPLIATVSPTSATICNGTIQQLTLTNPSPGQTTSTFNASTGLPWNIPDNNLAGETRNLTVSGIPAGASISEIRLTFTMTHTWVGDIIMNLRGPHGQTLNLVGLLDNGTGSNGTDNFTNTVVSSDDTRPVMSGAPAPRTGIFRADKFNTTTVGPTVLPTTVSGATAWSSFLALGTAANGTWTLGICDAGPADLGVLTSWSLSITYGAPSSGVWTANPSAPNTMFTDPAATIPYVAGSQASTIYVNPTVNTVYSVVYSTTTPPCTSPPTNIPVNVVQPITGVVNPANRSVCVGGSTTFSVTANGGPISYQWQVSTNSGASYSNITGATSSTLTLNNVTQTMHNNLYRVVMSAAPCVGTITTPAATLTVNPLPTVLLSANPTAVKPGTSTTIMVNSTPAGATYSWTFNGQPLVGVTGSSYVANVDGIGTYTVTVTDVNGCVNTSSAFTITGQQDSRLFIYPNPAPDGMFQVRLYSGINFDYRKVNIYNAAGARVAHKEFPTSGPWQKMEFNLSNQASGVYMVEVVDRYDTKLASGKVVIQR